jgi:long-chain acyl-CoA synthetase/feruloyl-CoA synthase
MSGYYRREDLTQEIIRDGWLYTGDLAMKRPDGHFMLAGRKRNIIKNAHTELVHIEEVELCLERHLQIVEAAVCGYTSAFGDERMAAFVVPSIPPDNPTVLFRNLRKYLAAELGRHKVPAVFFVRRQLPRSSAGKLLREQLKKEISE